MLSPVTSYEELSKALNTLLLQGVITNALPNREALEQEIRRGSLYQQQIPEGLLLIRRRETLDRLTFLIKKGQSLPLWKPERNTVVELPFRNALGAMEEIEAAFLATGFREILSRLRLSRKGTEGVSFPQGEVRLCEDLHAAFRLLCESFSPITGCLPEEGELAELAKQGKLLSLPAGILHYESSGKTTELRHLAVAPTHRRQGLGALLVGAYLNQQGEKLSRVWTAVENLPARRLYEHFGYAADGWQSHVLYYSKESKEERP